MRILLLSLLLVVPGALDRAVGKGETPLEELARRRADFVDDCLAIAERSVEEDPGLARRAALAVRKVDPSNPKAASILEAVGAEAPGLLEVVRERRHAPDWAARWTDLLADGTFGEDGKDGMLELREGASAYARPVRTIDLGDRYVLEIDCRRTGGSATSMMGVVFGMGGRSSVSAFLSRGKAVVDESVEGNIRLLGQADLPAAADGAWRRLAVVVEDGRATLWVDGQPLVSRVKATSDELPGGIAVVHAHCSVDVRWLQLGVPR